MDINTKDYVIGLLESYTDRKRKIAVLHFELDHAAQTSKNEMLETMALGHGDGSGRMDDRISDKTLYIALNYQNRVDKLNADTKEEIVKEALECSDCQENPEQPGLPGPPGPRPPPLGILCRETGPASAAVRMGHCEEHP